MAIDAVEEANAVARGIERDGGAATAVTVDGTDEASVTARQPDDAADVVLALAEPIRWIHGPTNHASGGMV